MLKIRILKELKEKRPRKEIKKILSDFPLPLDVKSERNYAAAGSAADADAGTNSTWVFLISTLRSG
jgi:transcription initiation factor TFIID subunit TAF12